MLDCHQLKKIISDFRKRANSLREELNEFKKTGKISEETKERVKKLKEEIEEFERREIGERVETIKKIWKENKRQWEEELYTRSTLELVPSIEKIFTFHKTPPFLLEKILNHFIEWLKNKEYDSGVAGVYISAIINQNIDSYIKSQTKKGKKPKEIKEYLIRLNIKDLPHSLSYLGIENRKKSNLIIEGNCGDYVGDSMRGGSIEIWGSCGNYTGHYMRSGLIEVKGSCRDYTGYYMKGGSIKVQGDCKDWTGRYMECGLIEVRGDCGNSTGYGMKGGLIIVKENCGDFTGDSMQGGSIEVQGDCGYLTARCMEGGKLNIKGKVASFDDLAFNLKNKGEIYHQGRRILGND